MAKTPPNSKRLLALSVYVVIAGFFAAVVITQFSTLRGSIRLIAKSNVADEIGVLILVLVAFVASAQTYCWLAFKRIRLLRTVIVEFGVSVINRIVPSGVGGLATNYDYLRKAGHSKEQAASVVAVNNFLGFLSNLFVVAVLLIIVKSDPLKIGSPNKKDILVIVLIIVVAMLVLLAFQKLRRRALLGLKRIFVKLKTYLRRPDSLISGFAMQIILCLANLLALYFSLRAIHVSLALSSVMLAYSFAIWLGAILPTPGGLGAVEAGLTGALVAFGLRFETALSGVLIFRLISYWLPFLIGGPALVWSRRHKYL